MSDGTTIIRNALKKIGAHSIVQPAMPESIEIGMNTLNSMLQLWLSEDIFLGITPLKAPGDELGEPLDTTQAIIDNLAIMLSPEFQTSNNIVSQELKDCALNGYIMVKNLYQTYDIPDKVVSSTLPRGAGERRAMLSNAFRGSGSTIKSSDG